MKTLERLEHEVHGTQIIDYTCTRRPRPSPPPIPRPPPTTSSRLGSSEAYPLVRRLAVLAVVLSLAACDSGDLTGPDLVSSASDGDAMSVTLASGVASGQKGEYGCSGSIWDPKRGRYEDLSLKVNVPKKTVEAAGGATYSPQFQLRDKDDDYRLLIVVRCTLPDVQDPKAEKAHAKVAKKLAKEVRKLQKSAGEAGVTQSSALLDSLRGRTNAVGATVIGMPAPERATQAGSCRLVPVDYYYWYGVPVTVYDCAPGTGGGGLCDPATDDECTGGGGNGGNPPPDECDDPNLDLTPAECGEPEPTPDCEDYVGWFSTANQTEREAFCDSPFYVQSSVVDAHAAAQSFDSYLVRRYPEITDRDSSPINAMKHAYWSAQLTIRLGPRAAKYWLDLHELPNVEFGSNTPDNSAMDFYNNGVGRRIGVQHGQTGGLGTYIEQVYRAGGSLREWPCGGFPGTEGADLTNGRCNPGEGPVGNPDYNQLNNLTSPDIFVLASG